MRQIGILAYLAGKLCALRHRSCKSAVENVSWKDAGKKKEPTDQSYGIIL